MEDKMNGRLTPKEEELIRLEDINTPYYNVFNVATTAEERSHIAKTARDFKTSFSYEQLSNIKNPIEMKKCTHKEIEECLARILSRLKKLQGG